MSDEATATAFVPGHVTGFFSVHRTDDPTTTGSRGAGLALSEGVTVRVAPAETPSVSLNGESVEMPPVERVLSALSAPARVEGETALPLGSGFGVSGALSLGTALAAADAFDRPLSENELVTVAHGAEVTCGTGLGDVVGQARGGAPIRLEPGAPGEGLLDGIPARSRVEYLALGELATEDVITGDTDRLSAAGADALSRLVEEPTLPQFMYASRRFAREAGVLTDRVRGVVADVSEAGGEASMAMLGETVFALGTGLSDAGYDPVVCRIHDAGATLVEE
ncbi:MAG: pantoate kinase [Haloferacaceae archaeon]